MKKSKLIAGKITEAQEALKEAQTMNEKEIKAAIIETVVEQIELQKNLVSLGEYSNMETTTTRSPEIFKAVLDHFKNDKGCEIIAEKVVSCCETSFWMRAAFVFSGKVKVTITSDHYSNKGEGAKGIKNIEELIKAGLKTYY